MTTFRPKLEQEHRNRIREKIRIDVNRFCRDVKQVLTPSEWIQKFTAQRWQIYVIAEQRGNYVRRWRCTPTRTPFQRACLTPTADFFTSILHVLVLLINFTINKKNLSELWLSTSLPSAILFQMTIIILCSRRVYRTPLTDCVSTGRKYF